MEELNAGKEPTGETIDGFEEDIDMKISLGQVLPSFIPVKLQDAVKGYEGIKIDVDGEKRLSHAEIRSLLAASTFLGTLVHAADRDFDFNKTREILTESLNYVDGLTSDERECALQLVDAFINFNIVREDHYIDDWVSEALWGKFQTVSYEYPSAMSKLVSYGLSINKALEECTIEN
jgi:hypothetical protein